MKNIYIAIAILLATFTSCTEQKQEISVVSFNIRMSTDNDGINSWNNRKEWVNDYLSFSEYDVIGMQEVLHTQLTDIDTAQPNYSYIGVGRDDGKEAGEYSPIFYNNEKFKVIESETFWLSANPQEVGVMGWDAVCNRVVTWGLFQDIETGKQFAVMNTHFDHVGAEARRNSAKLIKSFANQLYAKHNVPTFVTGDFNAASTTEPYKVLTATDSSSKTLIDTKVISPKSYGPEWTYNAFREAREVKMKVIDHIFMIQNTAEVISYKIDRQTLPEGKFLSDHYPVIVKFNI